MEVLTCFETRSFTSWTSNFMAWKANTFAEAKFGFLSCARGEGFRNGAIWSEKYAKNAYSKETWVIMDAH